MSVDKPLWIVGTNWDDWGGKYLDGTLNATQEGSIAMDVVDVDHVAIRVADLDRALAFYHDFLGLPIRDRDRFDAGDVPYVAVVAGGRHRHLVPTDDEIDVVGEHLCLLVRSDDVDSRDELDELSDALREQDVEIEPDEPRRRYGAYGRAWAAYVRDLDGRRVELEVH